MTLRMLDSITPANLPPGADAYAGYIDGSWPDFAAEVARFPGARVLAMAVTAADDAEGLDIEKGDAAPAQAPLWVRRQLARGAARPVLYANASTMPAVLVAVEAAGIKRAQVRLWSAHYDAQLGPHICGPRTCAFRDGQERIVPACDGTQWTDAARGAGGSLIDASLLADDFFASSPPSQPVKKYHPEEPMLLQPGTDTPVALDDGVKRHRFVTNGKAQVRVDFLGVKAPSADVAVGYSTSPQGVANPEGCEGVVVHVDAGTSAVSYCPVT